MSSPSSAPSHYDENHRPVLTKMENNRKDAQEIEVTIHDDKLIAALMGTTMLHLDEL